MLVKLLRRWLAEGSERVRVRRVRRERPGWDGNGGGTGSWLGSFPEREVESARVV